MRCNVCVFAYKWVCIWICLCLCMCLCEAQTLRMFMHILVLFIPPFCISLVIYGIRNWNILCVCVQMQMWDKQHEFRDKWVWICVISLRNSNGAHSSLQRRTSVKIKQRIPQYYISQKRNIRFFCTVLSEVDDSNDCHYRVILLDKIILYL